jgi:hypothetical protein
MIFVPAPFKTLEQAERWFLAEGFVLHELACGGCGGRWHFYLAPGELLEAGPFRCPACLANQSPNSPNNHSN